MLQYTIGKHKKDYHIMLFSVFWAYRTSTKTTIDITSFQLVYGLEATLPIECEIPSLKLVIGLLSNTSPEEEWLLYLKRLDEAYRIVTMVIKAQKNELKPILIKLFLHKLLLKVTWSFCMIKPTISWELVSSNLCGMGHIL